MSVELIRDASTGPGGVWVVDFGVNLAGVVEVAVPPGTTNLTVVHAEVLSHDMLPDNGARAGRWGRTHERGRAEYRRIC